MNFDTKINKEYAVKSVPESFKQTEIDGRTIKAVANTYNYFDYDRDVLIPGAAKRSINARGAGSNAHDKILHALNHDLTQLPGKSMLEAETVINGNMSLYVESKLLEDPLGESTLIRYKENIYNQHSIGFKYVDLEYIQKDDKNWDKLLSSIINPEDAEKAGDAYIVKEIELFEWSTVSFGANKLTPFLGTKTNNKKIHLQNIYSKMDALISAAKKGVKSKKIFDLQYSQLKEMINELTTGQTSCKQTLTKAQATHESGAKHFLINLIQ